MKHCILILFLAFSLYDCKSNLSQISGSAPEITGEKWINTDNAITLESLKGKVVLIEFWTFECYNCRNTIPYINKWYDTYKSQGLEIIGIHCPEFDHERNFDNVKDAVKELEIKYPGAIDNAFKNWYLYDIHAWPSMYVIDKKGEIMHFKRGEGGYKKTEQIIRELLAENP
jgi:thiol-disulfide isomerase/thioredoxin